MPSPAELLRDPVLAFLAILACNIVHHLLRRALVTSGAREAADLEAVANTLRLEAARNISPETFAAKAKAERKAIAVEKRVAQLRGKLLANEKHPALLVAWGVKAALCAAFVLSNWGEPVAVVPTKNALWPLGGTLVFPHTALRAMGGAVTAMPWVALSDRASAAALRALAPAT